MKIAIGVPVYSSIEPGACQSLVESALLLRDRGHEPWVSTCVGSTIDRNRNSLAHAAMIWGADVFVQADADQSWRASDLADAIDLVGSGRVDIVGFPIPTRVPGSLGWPSPILHAVDESAPSKAAPLRGFAHRGCRYIEVKQVSGLTVASRKCMHRLADQAERDENGVPIWYDFGRVDGRRVGEDVFFCTRWRSLGGKFLCNIDATVTHFGKVGFASDFRRSIAGLSIEIEEHSDAPAAQ